MKNTVVEILNKIGNTRDKVIPVLQAIQKQFRYLPKESLKLVAENSDISLSQISSIATFYADFNIFPVGKHIIKICIGTACYVKGAEDLYNAFKKELNISETENTDKNKLFTIAKVACLGCCMLAPAVQIDNHIYGYVEKENVRKVINMFLAETESENIEADYNHKNKAEIRVCLCSSCSASGSKKIYDELIRVINKFGYDINIKKVSCMGISYKTPLIQLIDENNNNFHYGNVILENIESIIKYHFSPKQIRNKLKSKFSSFVSELYNKKNINNSIFNLNNNYLSKQKHITTELCGQTSPTDIGEYISNNGFKGLKVCLQNNSDYIINELKKSGLRGRGGAGFFTYKKWELVSGIKNKRKYVICNADEGDPGAFMDRMLLESFPYRVLEGIFIAAYTVGADTAILYIREEYSKAIEIITKAINKCCEKNIFDFKKNFDVKIFKGAGSFVCGEETALIESIEGKRGIPKRKPPYPVDKGLFGYPTLINNVETFASIPYIILKGSNKFSSIGTKNSKGTKTFALAGKIKNSGLIEVPMGMTIKEIIYEIGGGSDSGYPIKAVQIGGPSGGCIPSDKFDLPIDFEALNNTGAIMGSGGLIVLDEKDCMVEIARYFLEFTVNESCGNCTACRVGTIRMLEIMDRIIEGYGKEEDIHKLVELGEFIKSGSLCGLGKTAPNPVLTTIRYFRNEYEAHINKKCPAGKCKNLFQYIITDDCIGCSRCAQNCPTNAIEFKPYERHFIIQEKCDKCGVCMKVCKTKAIVIKS